MKSQYLRAASIAALLLSAQPALAASFVWNPQSTDTGSANDFDTATQTFAPVSASALTFTGDGYYHSHGFGTQSFEGFTISALIDGISTTIYSSPITSFTQLSSLGTINFAGGNVSSITLSSKAYVGNAFHDMAGDGFTLNGTVSRAVPEPSTWAMMLVGFGAIGFGMRRKQRQTVRYNFA
jgi:hypothetical protein